MDEAAQNKLNTLKTIFEDPNLELKDEAPDLELKNVADLKVLKGKPLRASFTHNGVVQEIDISEEQADAISWYNAALREWIL